MPEGTDIARSEKKTRIVTFAQHKVQNKDLIKRNSGEEQQLWGSKQQKKEMWLPGFEDPARPISRRFLCATSAPELASQRGAGQVPDFTTENGDFNYWKCA